MNELKIAVVHEWLIDYWGSEKVVEQILNVFPTSDLFALVDFLPAEKRGFIHHKKVATSFIQRLPFAKSKYRNYFPLMPLAIEQVDLSAYDLIISSSHAVAKGIITHPGQLHICYCHSPIRYAWDLYHQYMKESGLNKGIAGFFAKIALHYMRLWDVSSANRVDLFIANSKFVASRIRKVYNRPSTVIYPPVNIESFKLAEKKEDFYLTASRFVPYKKIDLIVDVFSKMPSRKLVVIGEGPDYKKVSAAKFANIQFLGYQDFESLRNHMQRARAFIFAAVEDFGITPIEAMACGTPVIALAQGGSLETVIDMETGVLFDEQNKESLQAAIVKFETIESFDARKIRSHAEKFSEQRFRNELDQFVNNKYAEFKNRKEE